MIRIEQAGLSSSVQDRGRHGLRHLGVPWCGALVPSWMRVANALVGNTDVCPIIENIEGGLVLHVSDNDLRIAILGDVQAECTATLEDGTDSGLSRRTLAPWRSHRLAAGSRVRIGPSGCFRLVVVAIEGLQITPRFGSASTDRRGGFGGPDGRPLGSGDELHAAPPSDRSEWQCSQKHKNMLAPMLDAEEDVVRLNAVPGPQDDAFTDDSIERFFDGVYRLSHEVDRMGARLEGATLEHREGRREIVSDAIVPGSVQVPGNGKPIVLLADSHTAGGYPKVATVVSADLWKLALYRPGQGLQFTSVDVNTAVEHSRHWQRAVDAAIDALETVQDDRIDPHQLFRHNLIDGVVDARRAADELESVCNST